MFVEKKQHMKATSRKIRTNRILQQNTQIYSIDSCIILHLTFVFPEQDTFIMAV